MTMPGKAEEIVFEDLHGNTDDRDMEVDLDGKDDDISFVDDDDESSPDNKDTDDDEGTSGDGADEDIDDDQDDDDDATSKKRDERFSKKFQQRLDRERRAKQEAQQRAEAAERRLREARKEQAERRKEEVEAQLDSVKDEEIELEAQLEQAFENGSSKDQARLTSRLGKIQARRERLEAEKEAGFDIPDEDGDDGDGRDSGRGRTVNEFAEDWKRDNSDWFGRAGFERYTRMANRIDRELYAEGYDHQSEEYFEELTERMKEKAPKLFEDLDDDGTDDKDAGDKGKRKNPPVAGTSKEGAGSGSGKGKTSGSRNRVRITAEDKRVMREFGLDPNDPATLKEFAANKAQSGEED